jgi:hypothetical protein
MRRGALVSIAIAAVVSVASDGARHVSTPFTLKIESGRLERPLLIADGSAGAGGGIWFETASGRSYLGAAPDTMAQVDGGFSGSWTLAGGRTATVSVSPIGDGFVLELAASPDRDILGWGFALQASPEDFFTGVFERTVDGDQRESWRPGITEAMDLRGQRIEVLVKPTLGLYAPFFLSSSGYGISFDTTWPGVYDFCRADPSQVTVAHEGPSLRAEIFTGTPAEVVSAYSLRAGPPFLPPKWVFRPWRWRDEHQHYPTYYDGTSVAAPYNSEVVEDVLLMEAFDIPVGVYWVDRP